MAYTTINKSSDYFNTKLYTGNSGTQALTGVGFQPDWTWIKGRSTAYSHNIYDSVRGVTKIIKSNSNTAEDTQSTSLTAFNTDGFTLGSYDESNYNSRTYASWNWKAGTAVSGNTSGSGTYKTYTGSVNTTSGFSIIKYTGNGTAGHTIPHHLGVVPKMIIVKSISAAQSWIVLPPTADGYNKDMKLEDSSALGNSDVWNNTAPTSTVFSVGSNTNMNDNNATFISYSFSGKQGFSKMGSYAGNGNAEGTFVYTGFKPAFAIIKRSSASGSWYMYDTKRDTHNVMNKELGANISNAENDLDSGDDIDFLSNGFKLRDASSNNNGTSTYIYMAFAEAPLVGTNNVPCTAR